MNSIERMVARWREEDVPLNPGASAMQLESLERLMGMELPQDVLSFYSAVNGMHDYQHDARMVSIWSIERAVRERNIQEGEDEWGPFQDIAFADHSPSRTVGCIFACPGHTNSRQLWTECG